MMHSFFQMKKATKALKEKQTDKAVEEVSQKLRMMKEHLTIHMIEIERICPSLGKNTEEKPEKSANQPPYVKMSEENATVSLCDSILRNGLLEPLVVRRVCGDRLPVGGIFTLICGYRRFEALKILGVCKIPCVIVDIPANAAAIASVSARYAQRTPDVLSLREEIANIEEELGESYEDACKKLSIAKEYAERMKPLQNIGEKEKKLLVRLPEKQEIILNAASCIDDKLLERVEKVAEACEELTARGRDRRVYRGEVTPFLNSVEKLVHISRRSGVNAEWNVCENEDGYEVLIKLPKTRTKRGKTG